MDPAVAMVEAYLQVNGYFTVAEYPVLEAYRGAARSATDLDILAFRFPLVGCDAPATGRQAPGPLAAVPDPLLGVDPAKADMIVGEVKSGAARFNDAARNPMVLAAALVRFGCCPPETVEETVRQLLRRGRAATPGGHTVRMIAFGSRRGGGGHHATVTLDHVIDYLRRHLRRHWSSLGRTQLSHPGLAYLSLLEKAARGADR